MEYIKEDLVEAKRQIESTLHKLREALKSFEAKGDSNRYKSQITLATRRIAAFEIALDLVEREMKGSEPTEEVIEKTKETAKKVTIADDEGTREYCSETLISNLEKLHTTELGVQRIKKNLSIDTDDVVEWCKEKIQKSDALISRSGKNWYVNMDGCKITINAHSYTIITAHKT